MLVNLLLKENAGLMYCVMHRRNNYERLDILLNMAMTNAPANQQQSIIAKLKDPNSHYLPINTYDFIRIKHLYKTHFINN